ncbi:hypothetical protein glysoja_035891, partial [Glycine soja]
MNILSYNIRGLGKGIKWASIRRLVGKHKIDLLCLQETKRDSLDKALCQTLWGQSDFEWEWVPAVNTAGGLLCIWNNNNFQVEVKTAERGFIMLEGIQSWCMVGDFNCIRHPAERLGSRHSNSEANLIAKFNDWLAEMEIDDIPCVGKPFTWVRPNGSCKNHCPILMNSKCTDWGPKPFRVFDAWLSNKDY